MSNPQQTVVVTGASSGFGRDTAERFAAAGWRVFATIRDPHRRHAQAAAELERQGIQVVDLEVTDQSSVDRAAAAILADGPVDVLVNNAGAAYFGVVEAFTPELIQQQFDVNVFGPMRVSRAFLPGMRDRRSGLVVYVSSVVGRFALPFGGVYASSKWALEALAETSSYELSPLGVDVAIVQPGAYGTNISNSRVGPDDTARLEGYGEVTPLAANVFGALSAAAAERDSHEVAEAIFALAEQPAGMRPLRTPVPNAPDIAAFNDAVAPIQRQSLVDFALSELLPKVPAHAA
ncbi:MAG: oxidoreductase short chain dehydrogenase/reductase family [Candidatus Eremiobacteraeota bacterium]|nr:oxidoreductase short chain dehydrogenase/reductase family [Candidatus Eremiobacteraeota bacterium]